jgi:hypothetical protein
VNITPTTLDLATGQSFQFGYSSSNGSVAWSSSGGSTTQDGVFTAPYQPGTYTVTITSVLDPTKKASATVNVAGSSLPTLEVSPDKMALFPGASKAFTAKVIGLTSNAVSWSVVEEGGGSITSDGIYTASTAPGTYTVVATSQVDSTTQGRAQVTASSLLIDPGEITLAPGMTASLKALFPGGVPPEEVQWSILEVQGGTITADGTYQAPVANGVFHVQAKTPLGRAGTAAVYNGLLDALVIIPEVQIQEAGDYAISFNLTASNGNLLPVGDEFHFETGTQNPEFTVRAQELRDRLGADGPYELRNFRVIKHEDEDTGDGEVIVEQQSSLGFTGLFPLQNFQRPWVSFTGNVSVTGLDLNANGLIDQLQVQVDVQLLEDGEYTASATLVDSTGATITDAGLVTQVLPRGTTSITLSFDGRTIRQHGVAGPFKVVNLAVWGQRSNALSIATTVDGFALSQFEN